MNTTSWPNCVRPLRDAVREAPTREDHSMSTTAATYSSDSSSTLRRSARRAVSLDEVAYLARKRAAKLDTTLSTTELVQRVIARFDSTFDSTARPVDLDGWIRRALREIVAEERSSRDWRATISNQSSGLTAILAGLATPVRSPTLAKQRKMLLRRVSELIGGPECRVVFAMITETSLDRVAAQLNLSPIDVARLHGRGMQQLQSWLAHDHQLTQQLREASRQPKRARTSH